MTEKEETILLTWVNRKKLNILRILLCETTLQGVPNRRFHLNPSKAISLKCYTKPKFPLKFTGDCPLTKRKLLKRHFCNIMRSLTQILEKIYVVCFHAVFIQVPAHFSWLINTMWFHVCMDPSPTGGEVFAEILSKKPCSLLSILVISSTSLEKS